MAKFKKEILAKMRGDVDLYAKVAHAMGVSPGSLRTVIDRNGSKLNQFSIVTLVAEHLNEKPEDLVEESEVKESAK